MIDTRWLCIELLLGEIIGLYINFHKSGTFSFGGAKEEDQYIQLFYCESGSLTFWYLCTRTHFDKLRHTEWKRVEDLF
jgi:hypothetical protein